MKGVNGYIMKKRIISLFIALAIAAASAEPIFADNTSLYNQFKNSSHSEIKKLFFDNFSSFDISSDGNTYNDSARCLIILDAYYSGFDSFDELNQNVTRSAQKLADKKANPTRIGLKAHANVNLTFDPPTDTAEEDVFMIGDAEFIVLDEGTDDNGEPMFFVMAKGYYGTVAVDPDNQGRWDDSNARLLGYKLTNQMAFGNYTSKNLPVSILKHLDMLHEWNVEPGSGAGYTSETSLVAPISIISATEFEKYGTKIGSDGLKSMSPTLYWTRTPVSGDAVSHFTFNAAAPKVFSKNKGWGGQYLRPVFWLKSSFFKTEKMQTCGANVTAYIDKYLSEGDIDAIYSKSERKSVFGALSVEPQEVSGHAIVGETLTTDYSYTGLIPLKDIEITWERSPDKTTWEAIPGASGKSYTITSDDAGCFIRAAFRPTFDSAILGDGEVSYAVKEDAVFTDAAITSTIKEIDTASDIETLRTLLKKYESLFHCDADAESFPDSAVRTFMKDRVSTVDDVINLYNSSLALDAFSKATDADAKEKAGSKYLLGSIPAYKVLTEEQQNRVILKLFQFAATNDSLSDFLAKAEEYIMLERFNNAERGDVVPLIREYCSRLGVDISGLSSYQLEKAAAYVAGQDYGTDVDKLKAAVKNGIANANKTKNPSEPVEGQTGEKPSGGYIPPVSEKPVPSSEASGGMFNDLDDVPWAVSSINNLARKGIINGYGDGIFSPNGLVTRNEFVKMIVSAFGIQEAELDLSFEDITEDAWSREYIASAVAAEIISGIDDVHFGDGLNITRQDAAVISERVMKYKGVEMKSSSLTFRDSDEISDYAVYAVAKMKYCGIMSGTSDNMFEPKLGTTRAMAAVIINNLLTYYENAVAEQAEADADTDTHIAIKSARDKYDLLFALGIIKDEFLEDPGITRGEFAAMLAAFGKYDLVATEKIFDDVPSNNKYFKEIAAVYNNNIMAGKTSTTFAPDEPVTYGEAYNAIIAATGYADFAGGRGEADKALSKEPVFAKDQDELTGDMAKKMLFAALDIPVVDLKGAGSVKISDQNILSYNFDAYKERGIVNGVAGMYIGGRAERTDDTIIITVNGTDYLYRSNKNDYSDYLGCEVTYYYSEADYGYEVITMFTSKTTKPPLRLSFDQISEAKKDLSEISYDLNNKTKKVKISKTADFIYNGKRSYQITAADLDPDNGYITLIDTDHDDEYDVVKIDHYEYLMVAQIDTSNRSVLDKFTWKTFSLDDDVAEKISITKNGRFISLDNISKGDVLAMAKSRDGELLNVYVSDQKITGVIESKMPNDYEIKINDTVLKCIKSFDFDGLSANMNVTIGMDWNGYVVGYYIEKSSTDTTFGYLYKIVENETGDELDLHILSEDNEYVVIKLSDKPRVNDAKASLADVLNEFSYNRSSQTIAPQLIAYNTDTEGDISKIYTSTTPKSPETDQKVPLQLNRRFTSNAEVVYNSFGMTLDFEYNLQSSARLFDVTVEDGKLDKQESRVTTVGSQVLSQNSMPENLAVYNSDISGVAKICVYEHKLVGGNDGYKETFNTQSFVISKITEKWDESENGAVTAYVGYHAGNPVNYTITENLRNSVDVSKIKPGDVLLVWLSGTKINRFRRLYTYEESNAYVGETDLLCNYGDHNYDGSPITRGGTNNDYKFDWAQHIIERAEGKSGSTTAGATRWMSLFGSIELIYKAENYAYPVIKFKVAGKEEPASYTMDSNTRVYEYDTRNNTITLLESDNLNTTSDKAVVTARYGNVRDVIIYKY